MTDRNTEPENTLTRRQLARQLVLGVVGAALLFTPDHEDSPPPHAYLHDLPAPPHGHALSAKFEHAHERIAAVMPKLVNEIIGLKNSFTANDVVGARENAAITFLPHVEGKNGRCYFELAGKTIELQHMPELVDACTELAQLCREYNRAKRPDEAPLALNPSIVANILVTEIDQRHELPVNRKDGSEIAGQVLGKTVGFADGRHGTQHTCARFEPTICFMKAKIRVDMHLLDPAAADSRGIIDRLNQDAIRVAGR